MALTAPAKPAKPPIEAGPTRGVCYMVADLGTTFNEYNNKMQRQVLIGFELPDFREDVKINEKQVNVSRTIAKFFTFSMHEKANLRIMLESWRGKEFADDEIKSFDLFSIVGKNALLNVVNKTKNGHPRSEINGLTALPRGMASSVPERKPILFSIADPDHCDMSIDMPQWLKDMIMKSEEWKATHGTDEVSNEAPEEQPF